MKKTIWDWYAPFYKQAMLPDKKSYQYMYGRISQDGKAVEYVAAFRRGDLGGYSVSH